MRSISLRVRWIEFRLLSFFSRGARSATALCALAVLLATGSALAQQRDMTPEPEPAQQPESDPTAEPERRPIDEITVIEKRQTPSTPRIEVPRTYVTAADGARINVSSTEDFLSYQPSVIVRRRFIGDANGTLGMRGSNMFQTTRSMVFADGLPLHYMLQTQFSGAPRWGLVSPDEVAGVEVLYGPFSAEYGGGSMGGVVNIQTELPQERKIHVEGSGFLQEFDFLGTRENYGGRRVQGSYGNRIGKLSFAISSEHLFNQGQPMTFFAAAPLAQNPAQAPPPSVGGSLRARNANSARVIYFGDTGAEDATASLTKLRLGYAMGEWMARFTVGYEDRARSLDSPTSYLRDAAGRAVFSSSAGNRVFAPSASFTGNSVYQIAASSFDVSRQDRRSVIVGGALDGPLTDNWNVELDFSVFDLLRDASRNHPLDGSFMRLSEFNDTGWVTGDVVLRTQQLGGLEGLGLSLGYHYERYSIEIDDVTINRTGGLPAARSVTSSSGGKTNTHALFAQGRWQFHPQWDVQLGVRAESWHSEDGFRLSSSPGTGLLPGEQPGRSESAVSPKFSLGYAPAEDWQLRYSVARAVRFPIVEELFRNQSSPLSQTIADPSLEPERGIHHDFMIERRFDRGYVRANLYRETVKDVIFSQLTTRALAPGQSGPRDVTTFLPIGEQVVNGAELVAEWRNLMDGRFDVSANVSFADARIKKNPLNPGLEGNVLPRMPKWRGNLLLTYHWTPSLDLSTGFRFASDSYGALDNLDEEEGVFGAHDPYRFVNVRLNYRLTERSRVSFGMDNIFGEKAFVHHPWPMRSFYVEFGADL